MKIDHPSPARQEPPCAIHFRPGGNPDWCGGCDWQHMQTAQQAQFKKDLLRETLEHIGGFRDLTIENTVLSPHAWRYRNKVQVPFARERGSLIAGFFAPGSHRIVEFEDCPIQPEASVQVFKFVKTWAKANRWSPYQEDAHRGWLRHLLIRMNRKGDMLVALVVTNREMRDGPSFVSSLRRQFPQVRGIFLNIQKARSHVILGERWHRLWGADFLVEEMGGLRFQYGPGSFFQVNTEAAELLYERTVLEMALTGGETVLDVYCGVGALALLAARKAGYVFGFEVVSSAIDNARQNARLNNLRNVDFILGQAEYSLGKVLSYGKIDMGGKRCVAVVDPPRSGCERSVLETLLKIKPQRFLYVSCNPATLARDLKILAPDYHVNKVIPFDLFPQTSHIEALACLDLKERK